MCVCFCPATKKKRETSDVCCMTTQMHAAIELFGILTFSMAARIYYLLLLPRSAHHLHHSPSSLPTIPQTSVDAPPPIYAPSMINLPTRIGREIRCYFLITEIVRSNSHSFPKEVNLGSNFWAAGGMNHRKICLKLKVFSERRDGKSIILAIN